MAKNFNEFTEFVCSEQFQSAYKRGLETELMKFGDFPDTSIPQERLLDAVFGASFSMMLVMFGVYHEWANS